MRSIQIGFVVIALVITLETSGSAQTSEQTISVSAPVAGSIGGQAVHAFTFSASGNDVVAFTVIQKGIDLVLTLVGPDGSTLARVDSPNGNNGPEELTHLVEQAGVHRVEVRRLDEPGVAPLGDYEARLVSVRAATAAELREHGERKTLLDLEQQWETALERADLDRLAGIIADDFYYFNQGPGGMDRPQQLAMWAERKKSNADVVETHTVSDRSLQIFGDTAVSGGGAAIKIERKEGTSTIAGRFIHVWQKRNGAWKLAADHFYLDGGEPQPRSQVEVAPSDLARHPGTYQFLDGTQVTVSVDEAGLLVRPKQNPDEWSIPFVAESATEFFSKVGDFQLVFVRNNGPVADRVLFVNRGRAIRGQRVAETPNADRK